MQRDDKTVSEKDIDCYKSLVSNLIPPMDKEITPKKFALSYVNEGNLEIKGTSKETTMFTSSQGFEDSEYNYRRLASAIIYYMVALVIDPQCDQAKSGLINLLERTDKGILTKVIAFMHSSDLHNCFNNFKPFPFNTTQVPPILCDNKTPMFNLKEKKLFLQHCLDQNSLFGKKFYTAKYFSCTLENSVSLQSINNQLKQVDKLILPKALLEAFKHVMKTYKLPNEIIGIIGRYYDSVPQKAESKKMKKK